MMLLLCGLPSPSVMDAHVAALTSPLLRLCVVQLKLWKVGHILFDCGQGIVMMLLWQLCCLFSLLQPAAAVG
jgi:hypothetical protein